VPVTFTGTRDIPIADLTRFPGNARRGNVAEIRKSIRRHGQYRAIVVRDCPDGLVILAGNHTRDALEAEGHDSARCEVITCTDDEARRVAIADNRLAELGGYDDDALVELLSYLDEDYEGTGWAEEDVLALLAPDPEEVPPQGKPDSTPEPPAEPVTVKGDIWALGPHRIICGDCRDFETVTKLMDGRAVNLAFTSPPYADRRKYDESSGFRPIPPDEFADWFEDVQANVRAHLAADGSWFVNIKEAAEDGQRQLYVKDLTLAHVRRWGWLFVDELCWVDTRNGVPGGWPNRFKDAWEPVFHYSAGGKIKFCPLANGQQSADVFAYSSANAKSTSGSGLLGADKAEGMHDGVARPSNVIQIPAAASIGLHSAPFPVDLAAWFIRAYSDLDDAVFDPFMGSGSTLIAAHQENRIAYGCEISPAYCDVIAKRFQDFTGIKPERVLPDGTTEPVTFT
jgi:DNA modification methylase